MRILTKEFNRRTKKAFTLTKSERESLKKFKTKTKKKVGKLKKVGGTVDFRRLIGSPLRPTKKIIKKHKKKKPTKSIHFKQGKKTFIVKID